MLMLLFAPAECESPQCWTFLLLGDFLRVCGTKIPFIFASFMNQDLTHLSIVIMSSNFWVDMRPSHENKKNIWIIVFSKTFRRKLRWWPRWWIWKTLTSQLCWGLLPRREEYSLLKRRLCIKLKIFKCFLLWKLFNSCNFSRRQQCRKSLNGA